MTDLAALNASLTTATSVASPTGDEIMTRRSAGCFSALAWALNASMESSAAARAAYLATWGYEWSPVPCIGMVAEDDVQVASGSVTTHTVR